MKNLWKKYSIAFITSIIGTIIGYYYWKFYGCENGCTIKSNPRLMIIYGLVLGFLSGDLIKSLLEKIKQKPSQDS